MRSRDFNLLILGVELFSKLGLVLLDLLTGICMNDVRYVSPTGKSAYLAQGSLRV
jgi:hypothetical protein